MRHSAESVCRAIFFQHNCPVGWPNTALVNAARPAQTHGQRMPVAKRLAGMLAVLTSYPGGLPFVPDLTLSNTTSNKVTLHSVTT